MGVHWVVLLWTLSICRFVFSETQSPKRIGIIGGGIGGCAASLFLRDSLKNQVDIVVYEAESIGGRVQTVKLQGNEYEAGASIFHEKNELFQRLIKRFGLKTLKADDDDDDRGTLINYGAKVLYRSSNWSVFNAVKALYRYGLSPLKLKPWVDDYITKFARVYELFAKNCSYPRPSDLMYAADAELVDMFFLSLTDAMTKAGFGELFITEVAGAAMRVNYNQDNSVPAFVGSISLAGMEGPLLRVKSGNQQLPYLACKSASTITRSRVVSVEWLNGTSFQLVDDARRKEIFDFVVLGSPLIRNRTNVEFVGFPPSFSAEDWVGSYQTTVATFVEGQPNYAYFGSSSPFSSAFNIDPSGQWSSIGRLSTVMGNSTHVSVWKIFSRAPLDDKLLSKIFVKVSAKTEVDWKAYPNYSEPPRYPPPFVLHSRLFYLNAVEWAGSAMEMSLIAAHNIANAISNEVLGLHPQCPAAVRTRHKDL